MFKAIITAALLSATPSLTPAFAGQVIAHEAPIFVPGVYQGQWKDGQILTKTVVQGAFSRLNWGIHLIHPWRSIRQDALAVKQREI